MVNRMVMVVAASVLAGVAISTVVWVGVLPDACSSAVIERPALLPPGPRVPTSGGQRF